MLGFGTATEAKDTTSLPQCDPTLVGYILTTKNDDPDEAAVGHIEEKARTAGFALNGSEWDIGHSATPYRVGLWRALRRLICAECEPRRLPLSLASFEDFLSQALKPCVCRRDVGAHGIVVSKLDHICNDHETGGLLVVALAKRGKHLFGEDGVCLSCCHPATKKVLGRAD
jgi:hypothetical protein